MPREADAMEPWTVRTRAALWLAAGFFTLLALGLGAMWLFYVVAAPDPKAPVRHPFPAPDLELYLRHEDVHRPNPPPPQGYAWADRAHGRVRVPIERAMQAVAAEGDRGWAPLQADAPQ